jgi:hypothetical protein
MSGAIAILARFSLKSANASWKLAILFCLGGKSLPLILVNQVTDEILHGSTFSPPVTTPGSFEFMFCQIAIEVLPDCSKVSMPKLINQVLGTLLEFLSLQS